MAVALAGQLREGTKKSHTMAENTGFVACFLKGVVEKKSYRKLISDLYFVYEAMEEEIERLVNEEHPVIKPIGFKSLFRKETLVNDLEFYFGENWKNEINISHSAKEYVERIREVAKKSPELLVGHHYTRYIGDLSGFKNGFLSPISMANGKRFKPGKAYKDSKLCNMVTVQELSKRYPAEKIIVNSLYPGCVADTKLFRDTPWIFRFLFPIFQKFITKGYVSQRLAGERVAQVATYKEFAKPSVHWSWGNRQKTGRKAFSQKLSKRIIDTNTSQQTYDLTSQLVGLD